MEEVPKKRNYTPNYGATLHIIDDKNTHIVKDDKENELVIEVFPININEDQIMKDILQEDTNRWIIKHETKIVEPSKQQIQHAIESGEIMQISQTLRIIDNYGIPYMLTYNKKENRYENKNKNIGRASNLLPLPDAFIDYFQANDGVRTQDFPISSRALYMILQEQLSMMDASQVTTMVQQMGMSLANLAMNVESLNNDVRMLTDRVTQLEGGGRGML